MGSKRSIMKFSILLLGLGLIALIGCPGGQQQQRQQLSAAQDAQQDVATACHSLYYRIFEIAGDDQVVVQDIPQQLDITQVKLSKDNDNYYFQIGTNEKGLQGLLEENTGQVGIFVDSENDGSSNFMIITTGAESAIGVKSVKEELTIIEGMERFTLKFDEDEEKEKDWLEISIPLKIMEAQKVTDASGWFVFTGYSPEQMSYQTQIEQLTILPIVDIAYQQQTLQESGILVYQQLSGTGQQCQVTDMGINTCPPSNPPVYNGPYPGGITSGWLCWEVVGSDRKIQLWCDGSSFGLWVEKGLNNGWIAKCPFAGGQNYTGWWDADSNGSIDQVYHCVYDGGYSDDGDKYVDQMDFNYNFADNLDTIKNKEYDNTTNWNLLISDDDPSSPHAPFASLHDVPATLTSPFIQGVPGTHNGPPTHP